MDEILDSCWLAVFLIRDCAGGGATGSTLVEQTQLPSFCSDAQKIRLSTSDADRLLLAAEKAGWLERGKMAMSHSQRAFAGLQYKSAPDFPSLHFWSLTRDRTVCAAMIKRMFAVLYSAAEQHISKRSIFTRCSHAQGPFHSRFSCSLDCVGGLPSKRGAT